MKRNESLMRIWKLFYSMKFAILLLLIIGISSVIGTVIPQGNPLSYYQKEYSSFLYAFISIFSLYHVYRSWWFITLIILLSLNLILCSIIRFPKILKEMTKVPEVTLELQRKNFLFKKEYRENYDLQSLFKRAGFRRMKQFEVKEGIYYFSHKNRWGHLGSWFVHVGLLFVIVFYMIGQMVGLETSIYGVPGMIKSIENTPYALQIDDFDIYFREDNSVEQYISKITIVEEATGEKIKSGELWVNNPFKLKGMNIYQSGTGWTVDMELRKNDEKIAERVLYQREVHIDDDKRIALQFVQLYPDYVFFQGRPMTLSPYPNNPRMLYAIFYEGFRVDMNVVEMGEEIQWEEYTFYIDNPRQFTYLLISRNPAKWGTAFGGGILLLGLIFAFYLHPQQLKALKTNDGKIIIWGDCSKNKEIFKRKMEVYLNEINGLEEKKSGDGKVCDVGE